MSLLFLQDVASPVLDYIGMRVGLDLRQELNFLPEDEFGLFVIESNFFNAFDVAFFVGNLINHAVASANHLPHFELFVQILVATHELNYFIAHYMRNSITF